MRRFRRQPGGGVEAFASVTAGRLGDVHPRRYDPITMQVIETLSVEEAAVALGLRPAAIRLRIKSGELAAAFVGRKWRVGTASVNALLAGAAPTRSALAVQPVAQVVAQRPAEPLPEPVPDFNTVWAEAYHRKPADDPPYTEAEKRWFHDLTGRWPREKVDRQIEARR